MKMKKRFIKNFISTLYIHGWYVPLFLLLLLIKICLLSVISNSIRNHGTSTSKQHVRIRKNAVETMRSVVSTSTVSSSSTERNIDFLLENLIDMDINPTGNNRTSPTSIWLIYNSVPQCGEDQIVELLEQLAEKNRFSHQQHEYQTPWPRFLLEQEQNSLVQWFQYQHLPKSYSRYFFFVNFTKFQKYFKEKPIYFNIVRDPVTRLALEYYSRRNKSSSITNQEVRRRNSIKPGSGTEWYYRTFEECILQADPECRYTAGEKSFTLMTPFFCGQHNSCVVINDRWALQMAKFNIESDYSVVGVMEKMDQTLIALEKFVPKFFSGAAQLYNELAKYTDLKRNPSPDNISSYVRQIVESELYNEMELYHFILRRLALQQKKS